jgi:hypothetical protein
MALMFRKRLCQRLAFQDIFCLSTLRAGSTPTQIWVGSGEHLEVRSA